MDEPPSETPIDVSAGSGGRGALNPSSLQTTVRASPGTTPRWAWGMVILFFTMNVLNSADHWLLAAVLRPVSRDLNLTQAQAGGLSTVLLLALAATSLVVGYFVDRMKRPRLLATGFALWSVATVATGLARTYDQIQLARGLVGVGEGLFEVVALVLLMDLFPRVSRARALAIFFLAVPVGAVLGVAVGGPFAQVTTWHTAFLAVGAPGLLLALAALAVPEPVRGLSEGVEIQRLQLHERIGPSQEDYVDMMVNSSYTYSVFGITFSSFVLAGLAYWAATFLTIGKGLPDRQAEAALGLTSLFAATLGTITGAVLTEWGSRTRPPLLFIVPGLGMLVAIPFILLAIYGRTQSSIFTGLLVVEGVIFANIVPCYTIIAGVVMPNMRGVACGATLASTHLLGDLWSPSLMGWMIDTFGQDDSMATIFGRGLTAIGATPMLQPGHDPENLTAGMLALIPALLIAGIVLLAGSRHLRREMALMLAKLRAVPSRSSVRKH